MPFTTGAQLLQLDRERFDFSLPFEQLFFSIIPATLFITIAPWRVFSQARKPVVINASRYQLIKVGAMMTYDGLRLALLALIAVESYLVTKIFIAAATLEFVAAFLMVPLSILEHSRNPRPSVLLSIYLSLTVLLDISQARTLFLSSTVRLEKAYSRLFCTTVAFKTLVLLLEAKQKTQWTLWRDHKEHSPEETSNIFNLGVFYWLNNLFRQGYEKILAVENLYPLDSAFDAESLHEKFSRIIKYEKLMGQKFGLLKALARSMKSELLMPIPARLAMLGFQFCQPFFIERLLEYLEQPEHDRNTGYGFIGASFFIYAGIAISKAFYWYLHNRARTVARSTLITEIYSRAMKSRIGVNDDSAALTLMSADMERIRLGTRNLHELWACTTQVALAGWMLYIRLDIAFVAPIGLVLVCFAALGILMRFAGDSQRAWMAEVQKRTGLTATVIAGMKNLKLSGLYEVAGRFVQQLRVEELASGARFRKLFLGAAILGYIPYLIGPPITFASTYTHSSLDAATVFSSLAFITLLTYPLERVFESLPQLLSAVACIGRIQAFVERDCQLDFRKFSHSKKKETLETEAPQTSASTDPAISITNGEFGWQDDNPTLKHVTAQIPRSSLSLIVGPVGAGKSTFCKALIGETPFSKGQVACQADSARVGFCEQTPFLFNSSIRENIVGFSLFDSERYSEVVNATALNVDFASFSERDFTNIGSDGITLSGGQKQRVSLARALYLRADMLVLDDVFSGLDADTEERIFQQVFGSNGLLRRRRTTVVLCTHSIRHPPSADNIIVLNNGTVLEQGPFEQLIARDGYVQSLGLKINTAPNLPPEDLLPKNDGQLPEALRQMALNTPNLVSATEEYRQTGDGAVYKHYAKSMGWPLTISSLVFGSLWWVFTNYPSIWLTYWTDDVYSEHPSHGHPYYAGIYAFLNVCALLSLLSLGVALLFLAMQRAGAYLHQEALNTLVGAPLRLFTKTDTGVITNLFSQDLNLIDTELPDSMLNTIFYTFHTIGQAAVILTSSAYLAIAYPFLVLLLYLIGKFYLRTSRQLRLLDLESKSPLYTHFIDTLKGVATLRASGFVAENIRKNALQLNRSQRPAYLLSMIQEWLNLVLELVVTVLAVMLVSIAVRLGSKSGFAGASLYSLVTLGDNLAGIALNYTRLETCLGAISRLLKFNQTTGSEDKENEDMIPPIDWPMSGAVVLNGVSASYDTEKDQGDSETPHLALNNLHISIQPGEKLAICGRTGSGKSSVVSLLLKLLEPTGIGSDTANRILIDNMPLDRINRRSLRQQIIAVPQEAVFLPSGSTFQVNLDPTGSATAEQCEEVLRDVGLWDFIRDRGGLKAIINTSTFSAGQRQLVSIGRALLRGHLRPSAGGILLLDEVSSSVDRETERQVQHIIKAAFKNYTVIAISHRLDMIMDFDRVAVMDAGEIVEVGVPLELAAHPGSRFGELVTAAAKTKR
ncbi:putative ABC multidrug transporter [Periconia macrospinosa]|uniref:Putative ABC multidrug transporter n=1 Tax=Periconia macrospinosa TaxID=97972 RepID=A0A2V1DMM9_9PLEO|nr:putative ABC multidrug transporter [Periconia macrospinosa]